MHTTRPPRTYWGGVSVQMEDPAPRVQCKPPLHIANSPSLWNYLLAEGIHPTARTGVLSCHRHHSIPRARGGLSGPPHMQSILSVLCCPPSFWARVAVAAGKGGCRNFSRVPGTRGARASVCARCRLYLFCRRKEEGTVATPPGCGAAPLVRRGSCG